MTSIRADIRKDVTEAILTGMTSAGSNVFEGKPHEGVPLDKLPAVYVTTGTTIIEASTMGRKGDRKLRRIIDVEVHCVGHGITTGSVEFILDGLGAEIEPLLVDPPALLSAGNWHLAGETVENIASDSDGVLCDYTLTYRGDYTTLEGVNTYAE